MEDCPTCKAPKVIWLDTPDGPGRYWMLVNDSYCVSRTIYMKDGKELFVQETNRAVAHLDYEKVRWAKFSPPWYSVEGAAFNTCQTIHKFTKQILTEWVQKQGHDRCWYYPELFEQLIQLYSLEVPPGAKISRAEFEAGCKRFQDKEYQIDRSQHTQHELCHCWDCRGY